MSGSNLNISTKELAQDIVSNTNPKKISQEIKKHHDLFRAVNQEHGDTISEKVYNFLYPNQGICELGKRKKFQGINKGYGYCGAVSRCECAKKSVSQKVSETKKNFSEDKKQQINQKRQSTVKEKYGVTNVGQTDRARSQHKQFYSDSHAVEQTNLKIKQTKTDRYGDPNWNNPEKIKKTLRKTLNTDYYVERFNNENYKILLDKQLLKEKYSQSTPQRIADDLEVHVQTVYRHLNSHGLKTPYESSEEKQIAEYLQSLGITNIVRNTRKLLPSGKEIDIYLPDHKLAIEYNGVYWHHEDVNHITRSYHYNKYKQCQDQGISLITIFSNFWKSRPDVVKNILANRLGVNRFSIPARKCVIKEISSRDTRELLDQYHVQGYTPASICLGLYYENSLVAAMTFSKARVALGKTKQGYELVRYVSSQRVVGGASKLLKYFRKNISSESVYSYSNNEWSDGNLYNTLGFTLAREIPPSYWYLRPREEKLLHRFNFSKQKLVKQGWDVAMTEKQITQSMGLMKVWDCGKRLWQLD